MHSYVRSATAYAMLRDLLGDEKYNNALQEYIKRWNGKHPIPFDFFFTFEDVTKEDLYWFIKPWFYEQGYPDLGIKDAKYVNGEVVISVEKLGNFPVPVYLEINLQNGGKVDVYHSAKVWKDGKNVFEVKVKTDSDFTSILLGNKRVPDVNSTNNEFVSKK
jgi:aminopeptidase N